MPYQDLIFLEPGKVQFPKWIFNFDVTEDCPYRLVPTEVVPPACIEPGHAAGLLGFHVCGEPQEILRATLERGHWLTVEQIWSIISARGWPGPGDETKTAKQRRSSTRKYKLPHTWLIRCSLVLKTLTSPKGIS